MRRTLETAYYTFRDHKNYKNGTMKLIVNPDMRERLNVNCDVPTTDIMALL